jgi:alpha-L-fucosidase
VDITIALPGEMQVSHLVLQENITLSQRIEAFELEVEDAAGNRSTVYTGTVVGYKKIAKFEPVKAKKLILHIKDSRVCPTLSFIGVY